MNGKMNFHHQFYASANGFNGFRSYFNKIFDSHKFDKIVVLKGGPGTGKSTLLRKVAESLRNEENHIEIFRCSSDNNSLDGVIARNENAVIAVLDGTAPHERDAVIPGAVDEILNLGAAWRQEDLKRMRSRIFEINRKKNESYKNAYRYLLYSSVFETNIKAELSSMLNIGEMRKEAEAIAKRFFAYRGNVPDVRLISSFSKDGYKTLPTLDLISDKVYSVRGSFGSEALFLSEMVSVLNENGVNYVRIASALSDDTTEAIYLPDSGISIVGMGSGEIICDSTVYINSGFNESFPNRFSKIQNSIENYFSLAADEFKKASDYHLELEAIYTPSMDYSIINEMTEGVISGLRKILGTNP